MVHKENEYMTLDRNTTIDPHVVGTALRIGDDVSTYDLNPSAIVRIMVGDESVTITTDAQNTYTMYMTNIHGVANFPEVTPSALANRLANDLNSIE